MFLFLIFASNFARAQDCPKGSFWVNPHPRKDFIRSGDVYVSAASVTGHCRSKSKSYEFWAPLLVNGRPADWEFNEEKSVNWSRKEIEEFIDATEKLPLMLRYKVKIFRMQKSKSPFNPASSSLGNMVLYDQAFTKSERLAIVVVHELAHELYRNLSKAEKEKFQKEMNWTWTSAKGENVGAWTAGRSKYVNKDSDTSPDEDFANGVESYIFDRTRLKFKDPAMHKWLKSKYGDKLELE